MPAFWPLCYSGIGLFSRPAQVNGPAGDPTLFSRMPVQSLVVDDLDHVVRLSAPSPTSSLPLPDETKFLHS
ncbi:MAG: hypothetical protein SPG94_02640, partial [Candidatus Enterosoma sp.]|nr:hypothetical protein [Candidatus Enterosoma sp.]